MTKTPVQIFARRPDGPSTLFGPNTMKLARVDGALGSKLAGTAHAHPENAPELDASEAERFSALAAALGDAVVRIPAQSNEVVSQLVLSNTYTCNMGCTYCYNELEIKPVKGSQSDDAMTIDIAERSIDMTVAQIPAGGRLKLFFVGGEPLLERDLMEAAVAYAEKRVSSSRIGLDVIVYTNGTLITQRTLDWFTAHNVSVVVSLDGPVDVNTQRVYLSGRPTTHVVLRNMKRLRASGSQKVMRVRSVSQNGTSLLALHRYLYDLGFNEIHVQPMYDERGITGASLQSQLDVLEWWVDLLKRDIVVDIMPFGAYFQKLLMRGTAVSSWMPCNAGRNAVTVGPDGRIYSCHHAIEETAYQMGTVSDGLPTLDQRRPFYFSVDERSACRSCWARHVCGGECYHRSSSSGRGQADVISEVCDERRSLIGAALDAFTEVAEANPAALARLASGSLSTVEPREEAYVARTLERYA